MVNNDDRFGSGRGFNLSFMLAREADFQLPSPVPMMVTFTSGSSTPPQGFSASSNTTRYWRIWEPKSMCFKATSTSADVLFSVSSINADLGLDYATVTCGCGETSTLKTGAGSRGQEYQTPTKP